MINGNVRRINNAINSTIQVQAALANTLDEDWVKAEKLKEQLKVLLKESKL